MASRETLYSLAINSAASPMDQFSSAHQRPSFSRASVSWACPAEGWPLVCAGNAPGLNDGAAAVVIASRAKAEQMGVKPMARILGYGSVALEPKYLFAAPAKTIPVVLKQVGWKLTDVDLIELNEAFAAPVLAIGYDQADRGWGWGE